MLMNTVGFEKFRKLLQSFIQSCFACSQPQEPTVLCHFVSTANLFEIVRTVRVHFNGFVWCCSFAELVLHTSNLIFYPIEASGTGGHWCFCNSILVTSIYSLVKNVIGCGGAVSQCVFVKHVQAVWFPWHLLDSWRVALLNDFEVV